MKEGENKVTKIELGDEINSSPTINVIKIGQYERPIVVIDDVFKDPGRIRDLALSLQYTQQCENYPGLRSTTKINSRPFFESIKAHLPISHNSYVSGTSEFCYYSHSQSKSDRLHLPHTDSTRNTMASVMYLNLPDQCSGGTAFYRHRPTKTYYFGEESFDEIWPEMQKRGLKSYYNYMKELNFGDFEGCDANRNFEIDLTSEDNPNPFIDYVNLRYEMLAKIEMRFNRMIVYESSLIHGPLFEKNFNSSSPDGARLTIRSFFYSNIGVEESRFMRFLKEGEKEVALLKSKSKRKKSINAKKPAGKIPPNSVETSLSL